MYFHSVSIYLLAFCHSDLKCHPIGMPDNVTQSLYLQTETISSFPHIRVPNTIHLLLHLLYQNRIIKIYLRDACTRGQKTNALMRIRFGRSWHSNPWVRTLVESNEWLKNEYLLVPRLAFDIIRTEQGHDSSVIIMWLSGIPCHSAGGLFSQLRNTIKCPWVSTVTSQYPP